MGDRRAALAEQRDVRVGKVNRVHRDQPFGDETQAIEPLERPLSVAAHRFFEFTCRLVQMDVDRQVEFFGQHRNPAQACRRRPYTVHAARV